MIPLFYPQLYKEEWLGALGDLFDTRWLGQGPMVDKFEKEFGKKFNYKYCLAVNSGSSALELAYELLNIQEGDEVITTSFTCTSTNLPLVRRKATIVFADINDNLLIDYKDVKKKITPKTKAIVVVTLGGLPIDKRIFDLGLPVVVDAAQSVGVPEERGDYICYSFQAIKHFTTGDGGMLVVNNRNEYNRAKRLRWFGIDRESKKKANFYALNKRAITLDIEEPGFKYHMTDIAATMGLVGLRHSDEILAYRRQLCKTYVKHLPKDMRCVYGGSYWLFAIITKSRDDIIDYLRDNGVECDLVQLRNDIFKVFGGKKQDLPHMNQLENEYVYLPLNPKVTVADVMYICKLLCDRKS